MIFVTVGTHEQPFDRLVSFVDELVKKGIITEKVIIQTGYSTFEPANCEWHPFLPFDDMVTYVSEARIVITHGGPSSFIMPLQVGKTPVVVPRRVEFGEHVNNHQLEFCRNVSERMNNIILIENIDEIENAIVNYDGVLAGIKRGLDSNNKAFCDQFSKMVDEMMK